MKFLKYGFALCTLIAASMTTSVSADTNVGNVATDALVVQVSEAIDKENAVELIKGIAEPLKAISSDMLKDMTLSERESYKQLISALDGFLYSQNKHLDNPVADFSGLEFKESTNWLLVLLIVSIFVGPVLISEVVSTLNGLNPRNAL